MGHMQRLFNYVNETGSMAVLGQIDAPPTEYESIADVFRKTYEHECLVTSRINELADAAMKETDYSTFNFLQWYVAEQHEEEKLFKSILDKIELIGADPKNLFFIDQEVRSKMVEAQAAPPYAPDSRTVSGLAPGAVGDACELVGRLRATLEDGQR